jgi:FKBP-type peptidyl-prolyl cis-trans isomerase 2|tara:strand:+ start:5973 stop:6491 length:519 start_codon:yes stop_codon:yes gene_type:complete
MKLRVYRKGDEFMGKNVIEKGMVVKVHYKGTLPESGEVFDSSEGRDPLKFTVGKGEMIPGFEEELMGSSEGDNKTFTLTADRAYGHRDEEAILQIPRSQFTQLEEQTTLEVGFQLVAQMPHGPAPFTIADLSDETVTADFNHALAGKDLTFEVDVVEVVASEPGCGDATCGC